MGAEAINGPPPQPMNANQQKMIGKGAQKSRGEDGTPKRGYWLDKVFNTGVALQVGRCEGPGGEERVSY